jgi:hypothetical protein
VLSHGCDVRVRLLLWVRSSGSVGTGGEGRCRRTRQHGVRVVVNATSTATCRHARRKPAARGDRTLNPYTPDTHTPVTHRGIRLADRFPGTALRSSHPCCATPCARRLRRPRLRRAAVLAAPPRLRQRAAPAAATPRAALARRGRARRAAPRADRRLPAARPAVGAVSISGDPCTHGAGRKYAAGQRVQAPDRNRAAARVRRNDTRRR